MRNSLLAALAIIASGLFSSPAFLQEKGGEEETGPYEVVSNWPTPWSWQGDIWGSQPGIFTETPNRIFIAARGELRLPEKLGRGFNGAWGSLNQRATEPTPEMRNCIVVVDGGGKVIEAWTQWDKLFILISADQHVWVADGTNSKVLEYDQSGRLLYYWGTYGMFPGGFWELHQMSADAEGNLYGADSFGGRVQKFKPRAGADRAKLIGALAPLAMK